MLSLLYLWVLVTALLGSWALYAVTRRQMDDLLRFPPFVLWTITWLILCVATALYGL